MGVKSITGVLHGLTAQMIIPQIYTTDDMTPVMLDALGGFLKCSAPLEENLSVLLLKTCLFLLCHTLHRQTVRAIQ